MYEDLAGILAKAPFLDEATRQVGKSTLIRDPAGVVRDEGDG
jgi:hypothetical protein